MLDEAEEFVQDQYPGLRRYLRMRGCPDGPNDEIANDASLIVVDRWKRLHSDPRYIGLEPRAYLFTVATRLWHRRVQREIAWRSTLVRPGTVMRYGGARMDAEDAAQLAFVEVFRVMQGGKWDQIERPRTWVRQAALRNHRSRTLPRSRPEAASRGPGDADLAWRQPEVLAAALRLLDDKTRAVLDSDLDGLSTAAIADQLGITDQQVRALRRQGKRQLNKAILAAEAGRAPEGG